MRHIRHIFTAILAVLMSLPAFARDFEYQGLWYTVIDENAKTCQTKNGIENNHESPDDTPGNLVKGELIIPSVVSDGTADYTVVEIGMFAFSTCNELTSVVIPQSVKIIRHAAFSKCTSLTSVSIPETVTEIESNVFSGCTSLTEVRLPANITSIQTSLFSECTNLVSVNIPDGVTYIGESAFMRCESLPSLTLPESATSIVDYVFEGCSSLESINIPEGQTYIGKFLFAGCSSLTSIQLPESINTIYECAFERCSNLTSIYIPESVSVIQQSAFSGCEKLKSIDLPKTLASIEEYTFAYCFSLESVYIPDGVTYIGSEAFYNCRSLTSINIPSGVTYLGSWAFYNCASLQTVTYNAEKPVAASEDVFIYQDENNNYQLDDRIYETATLEMPNASLEVIKATVPWNKFKNIVAKEEGPAEPGLGAGDDFEYQGLWYTVIDADAKTCQTKAGTQEANAVFPGNAVEGDIIIPHIASDGTVEYTVVGIGEYGFANCSKLNIITVPQSVTYIAMFAFSGCSGLTSINLPRSVEMIEPYTFDGCTSLTSIYLPQGVMDIGMNAFNGCSSLTSINIPESVFYIAEFAFGYCTGLTSVTYNAAKPIEASENVFYSDNSSIYNSATLHMPNATLADIQATIPWSMFKQIVAKEEEGPAEPGLVAGDDFEYQGLWYTVIDADAKTCKTKDGVGYPSNPGNSVEGDIVIPSKAIGGSNEYTVISIGENGFYGCDKLASMVIPESVTYIGAYAFHNCSSLTSINIPEGVTSIENFTFNGCSSIASVTLPESLTSIGNFAFGRCSSLTSLNIPDTVTFIDSYAFFSCGSLTAINIPDGVTSIGDHTFYQCTSLTSIKIPSSVTTIGPSAFMGCENLSSINIPDAVTSIGETAFYGCRSLTSINIPAGVTSIGEWAFALLTSLTSVTYNATTPIVAPDNTFSTDYDTLDMKVYDNATLNMPNANLADIQATVPWNMFKKIVAKDGSVGMGPAVGDDVEYRGIVYTILSIDAESESGTVMTKAGEGSGMAGNSISGDVEIPGGFDVDDIYYEVTQFGEYSFSGSDFLTSITLPKSTEGIGKDAFSNCGRLTSIVWQSHNRLDDEVVNSIANPNLLVYVDSIQFAPSGLDRNVVVMLNPSQHFECSNLVLTPKYPFKPIYPFDCNQSSLTKSFTQSTPIGGSAGWETLVLPFDVKEIIASDGRNLTPFAAIENINDQYPFWLYEANSNSGWLASTQIKAGVPYIISMPNNEEYNEEYRISGDVTFSSNEQVRITPDTAAPYEVTWASGRQFRSLWLPLSEGEEANAMGLNVGIDNLTGNNGELLAPGSAFHVGVVPQPLEAYVTRVDGQRAMKIGGNQSHVMLITADKNLDITSSRGSITITSGVDQVLDICTVDGIRIKTLDLKAGVTVTVSDLTKGLYIIANRKIAVK